MGPFEHDLHRRARHSIAKERDMWQLEMIFDWLCSPQGSNAISAALALWATFAARPLWPGLATAAFLLALACAG